MNDRWVEVTPSPFAHEAEGLRIIRDLLPTRSPFRAWTNFEFRDDRGTWSEVDLLILAPDGLHLVELKYYSGRLRGNDQTWLRDGHAAEDSPLRLANRKAKRLRSKLMRAFDDWKRGRHFDTAPPLARDVIPFIQESVFLHHPNMVCELADSDRLDLYGLPDDDARSGLAPITDLFTGTPRFGTVINQNAVVGAMQLIGLRSHKREAGTFVLDDEPLEDGPGWQDWLGTHKLLKTRRRIRFRTVPEGSSEDAHRRVRRIAEHEVRVMQHLSHDAVLRPEDFVDSELGPGLVYPYDPSWQRLDLWLAGLATPLGFDDQLTLVRKVAETLQYAHGRNVVHRGLNPRAILVRTNRDGRLHIKVGDWQGVGRTDEATSTEATRGVTQLADVLAGEVPTEQRWARDAFTAPEGVLVGTPDRLRLDVFSLGALAFYLVTGGQLPAHTRADLSARLRDQDGLDVSVELPEVPPSLREAILSATRPQVSERLPDVGSFLEALDAAVIAPQEEVTDPLDAGPGAILDGRFELKSRLGAGSTAVGLLVTDLAAEDKADRVLKVAIDDAAARRLHDEAEALRQLSSPRIVRLLEGPIDVGGRSALLLASAGRETLSTHLGNRERLSLDLLDRWGTDLLETVTTLDQAGITHRDIKPANLGVRTSRGGDRAKHLVLFDFSLTRAAATDIQAGTRPYLDPFLENRRQYDSAAERYAAAVVLFEMATGHAPVFGDGLSEPAVIPDQATIIPSEFDPSAAAPLTAFFTRALSRDAAARHDTAAQMLLEWRACFPASSIPPIDADELAEHATEDTLLAVSGLTPRAISALEQLKVVTVGDLAQVDAVRLNRLPGMAAATREEIKLRAKTWRDKYRRKDRAWKVIDGRTSLPDPHDCADVLLSASRHGKEDDRAVALASLLLGVLGSVDPNATHAELAATLTPPVTRGRVSQLFGTLQERWASDPDALTLLNQLATVVDERLTELGGVATFNELSRHLMGLMVAGPSPDEATHLRLAQGLLRCTMDREAARERAEGSDTQEETGWLLRRREGRPLLVAGRHDLLDITEALARRTDALVDEAGDADALVPAARAAEQLGMVLDQATVTRSEAPFNGLREGHRLAQLAALVSRHAGASAVGELHHRNLAPVAAMRYALPAVVPGQLYQPSELRARVQARFPQLAALPQRPALDAIIDATGRQLHYDDAARGYRASAATSRDTTGLESRLLTRVGTTSLATGPGAVGQRLIDSRKGHSFVALGVEAARQERLVEVLINQFDAMPLDLTHTLMDALYATAAAAGVGWDVVLGADADQPGSRAHNGLSALVQRSLPAVTAAIDDALATAGDRPLTLLDASLLARHGALGLLAGWMDLSTPRPTAVWLVVPQLHSNLGPMVDGHSLPLTAPNQYVSVPLDWIETYHSIPVPEGHPS